jgi:hypothetical protein
VIHAQKHKDASALRTEFSWNPDDLFVEETGNASPCPGECGKRLDLLYAIVRFRRHRKVSVKPLFIVQVACFCADAWGIFSGNYLISIARNLSLRVQSEEGFLLKS